MQARLYIQLLAWLCFVTLPALGTALLPSRPDGVPAVSAVNQIGKAVRPLTSLAAATAELKGEPRRKTEPEPPVAAVAADAPRPASRPTAIAPDVAVLVTRSSCACPYAPRAPPAA